MRRYDTSTIKSLWFREYSITGSPTRGTNMTISGSFTYGNYTIEYYTAAPGLIHYTISQTGSSLPAFAYSTMPFENRKEHALSWNIAPCFVFLGGCVPVERTLDDILAFNLGIT